MDQTQNSVKYANNHQDTEMYNYEDSHNLGNSTIREEEDTHAGVMGGAKNGLMAGANVLTMGGIGGSTFDLGHGLINNGLV